MWYLNICFIIFWQYNNWDITWCKKGQVRTRRIILYLKQWGPRTAGYMLVSLPFSFLRNPRAWHMIRLLYGYKFLTFRTVNINVSLIGPSWNVHQSLTSPNIAALKTSDQKVKCQYHAVLRFYFRLYPVSIGPIRFTFGTNIAHAVKSKCQSSKPNRSFIIKCWLSEHRGRLNY